VSSQAPHDAPHDIGSSALHGVVLVVDDERNIRRTLRMVLEGEGATVVDAASAEEALEVLGERGDVEVLVIDVKLPGLSGIELLERLSSDSDLRSLPVILISGHATVSDAVRATRLGAFDFFEKPLERDRVIVSVRNALRQAKADAELAALRRHILSPVVGQSAAMKALLEQVAKVGPVKARVLIRGESGTGKELVARAVHEASERASAPFVKVNCAAIPRELIESELFGHEKGAFTGATSQKKGLFEVADGGTILLDEIGDMDLDAQAKVLRVLQSGELMRVGGQSPIHVDVRVLAATHRNLQELVQTGDFREDLYFRLNVVPIDVPPLRERLDDVPLLARRFIEDACRDNGLSTKGISAPALEALQGHDWPGNVRELRNLIERMVIFAEGDIDVDDVPEEILASPAAEDVDVGLLDEPEFAALLRGEGDAPLKVVREAVERAYILQRLTENGWNVSRTAEVLGVERTHLHRKLRALKIQRGDS
jgi:DNA-binding NtrC family response regulator